MTAIRFYLPAGRYDVETLETLIQAIKAARAAMDEAVRSANGDAPATVMLTPSHRRGRRPGLKTKGGK